MSDAALTLALALALAAEEAPPPPAKVAAPPTYQQATAQAVREGRPLVVFLGAPARAVPGCVTCTAEGLFGKRRGIVVAVPHEGQTYCDQDGSEVLLEGASDDEVLAKAGVVRRRLQRGSHQTHTVPQPRPVYTARPPSFGGGGC